MKEYLLKQIKECRKSLILSATCDGLEKLILGVSASSGESEDGDTYYKTLHTILSSDLDNLRSKLRSKEDFFNWLEVCVIIAGLLGFDGDSVSIITENIRTVSKHIDIESQSNSEYTRRLKLLLSSSLFERKNPIPNIFSDSFSCVEEFTYHGNTSVMAIAANSTGSKVFTGDSDGAIWLNNVELGAASHFKGHDEAVTCLALEDDFLFSGSLDKSVRVWRFGDRSRDNNLDLQHTILGHEAHIVSITTDSRNKRIFTSSFDWTIRAFRDESESEAELWICTHILDVSCSSVLVVRDLDILLCGGSGGALVKPSISTVGLLHGELDFDRSSYPLLLLPDEGCTWGVKCMVSTYECDERDKCHYLYFGVGYKVFVCAIKNNNGAYSISIRHTLGIGGNIYAWVTALALDTTNHRLFVGSFDSAIRVYDTQNWKLKQVLQDHSEPIQGLVFDSIHSRLYSCSFDGSVRLYI